MQISRQLRYIFILLIGLLWIFINKSEPGLSSSETIPAPRKGFQAPVFSLGTLSNEVVSLKDLQGQVIIINFWATWCLPCKEEMPALAEVFEEYQDDKLAILAINSTSQDSITSVERFTTEYQLPFPILLDRDGSIARQYNVTALPTTFFIGMDGIIKRVIIGGPLTKTALRSELVNLLGEKKP